MWFVSLLSGPLSFLGRFRHIDWMLFLSVLPILGAGLITMNSFTGENYFATRQLIWIGIALVIFFAVSLIDFRFLRRMGVIVGIFLFSCLLLISLFILGSVFSGARSWFDLGLFAFQPSDLVKLVAILLLAKYFSRRHIEIANVRHILISGAYAFTLFLLVVLQPDFGSAMVIFFIWFGMVLVSGISKKHLLAVFALGLLTFAGLWLYVFQDYQKQRVITFINPLSDIHGSGYNAFQSMIAVGSGQMLGRGVGYGTQSRLQFLPEFQTDFIFAAYAEEWGFVGVILLFILFGILIWRILANAARGASNFEMLFGAGLAIYFMSHFIINVGMNIGLMPVTGITVPFMSYGGSHLVAEFLGLGILMGMRKYARPVHRDVVQNELVGV